jgi:hypothetical protein
MRAGVGHLVAGSDAAAATRARERIAIGLGDSQPFEQRARAAVLAMSFDPARAEPVLLDAIRQGTMALRLAAFDTLGQLGTAAAIPVIEDATHDPHTALPAVGALRVMAGRNVDDAAAAVARFKLPVPVADAK